ncbi:MAG: hypothetical protein OXH63_02075, partial [Gemmatimonadetes bacterium]|nr:hypothetical protein [Gemmatimonadota bacterium]
MQNSVRKIFPLAIALLLALCGAAVAGDNANVVISLDGEHAAASAGEQVQVPLSAAGMVGVKQVEIILTVLPAEAFDIAATTFTPAFGFSPGSGVEVLGDDQIKGGVATLSETVDGDGALGVFTLTMSSSFSRESSAEIVVSSVSLGPSSVDRDVVGAEGLFIVNWAVPPPNMLATSSVSLNPAYSSVGTGAAADGSPGEIEFSVNYTDDGVPAKGQTIAWYITKTGSGSA